MPRRRKQTVPRRVEVDEPEEEEEPVRREVRKRPKLDPFEPVVGKRVGRGEDDDGNVNVESLASSSTTTVSSFVTLGSTTVWIRPGKSSTWIEADAVNAAGFLNRIGSGEDATTVSFSVASERRASVELTPEDDSAKDDSARFCVDVDPGAFLALVRMDACETRVVVKSGGGSGSVKLVVGLKSSFVLGEKNLPAPETLPEFYGNRKVFDAVRVVYGALVGLERSSSSSAPASGKDAEEDGSTGFDGEDLRAIFTAVKPNADACPIVEREYPELLPTPRRYQNQAVAWMMAREGAKSAPSDALDAKRGCTRDESELHPLWRALPDGLHYINPYSGAVVDRRFVATHESVSGGILADEMGLGKTVEMIMLCIAHQEPNRRERRRRALLEEKSAEPKVSAGVHDDAIKKEEESNDDEDEVRCVCGAREEDPFYQGMWIACEKCEKWSHARCVKFYTDAEEERLMRMTEEQRSARMGVFVCRKCIAEHASVQIDETCGATLVVCPSAILQQWREEVERHVRHGTFKVIAYEGQPTMTGLGGSIDNVVSAKDLAEADLVLTTYEALRKEIDIDTANGQGLAAAQRARRYERKYDVVPTPLTRLKWWRVVLDEAQMVESTVSKAAEMVRRLPAVHRWAVTGTPISRGLNDIYGLLMFLMVSPFAYSSHWWRQMIELPYEKGDERARELLHNLLKGLMWRNSRADMEKQLGVPPQGELVTWLSTSAVEQHWYSRQYNECSALMMQHINGRRANAQSDDKPISADKARRVMAPLLRLRQACDHPQAGSHGLAGGLRAGANVLSMEQISEKLIEKARVEAEEAQRLVAFALNALAGLTWCEGDFATVIKTYREVLQLESDGKDRGVRLDALQRLHALHNLHLALEEVKTHPELLAERIAPTLRDGELVNEANTERAKYLAQRASGISTARIEFNASRDAVEKHMRVLPTGTEYKLTRSEWYTCVIFAQEGGRDSLYTRVWDTFDGQWQGKPFQFDDLSGLIMRITMDLDEIEDSRKALLSRMDEISKRVQAADESDVRKVGTCSKCRKDTDFSIEGVVCMFCDIEPMLETYESKIFGATLQIGRKNNAAQKKKKTEQSQQSPQTDEEKSPESPKPPTQSKRGRVYAKTQEEANRGGPSCAENLLRMLKPPSAFWDTVDANAYKNKHTYADRADATISALEGMRKEFYKLTYYLIQQREEMAARDELEMAVLRIRKRLEHEMPLGPGWPDPIPEGLRASIVFPAEVPVLSVKFTQEKAVYESDLRKYQSQLKYLRDTLRKKQQGEQSDDSAMECPVCITSFPETNAEMCVWPCGHRTCVTCAMDLVRRSKTQHTRLACVTCRTRAYSEELNYVNNVRAQSGVVSLADYVRTGKYGDDSFLEEVIGNSKEQFNFERSVTVVGSWGTKIESVVRRLKWLISQDESVKCLVFSEWDDVLGVVEKAIATNKINSIRGASGMKFGDAVERFKTTPECNVLLLPLKRGAHGLNLTEAQHVLLLEPVLDPGMEAQAVKRVDRIGQTRPTCVHRFMIRGTIEENVFKFARKKANEMNDLASDLSRQKRGADEGLTVGDIRALLARVTHP